MNRHRSGFTIIELLIVIIVIAILASISIVAYSGVQSRARDSERVSDVEIMHKKLEMYYIDNGRYPNADDINNASFRRDILDIPDSASRTPGGGSLHYCWSINPDNYCYVPRNQANNADCPSGDPCRSYILSYRLESDPDTRIDLSSLNR